MLLEIDSIEQHERFVRRARAAGLVWGLHSDEGWASSESNHEDGRTVIPFWSDRGFAKRCVQGDWSHYVPRSIPLRNFVGPWLSGMHEDGTLVGTNWNAQLVGRELEPLELARELYANASEQQALAEPKAETSDRLERFRYFLLSVTRSGQLWILTDEDDGSPLTLSDDEENLFLVLWPVQCFAEACKDGDWALAQARRLELQTFVEGYLDTLRREECGVVIFPTASEQGLILMPDQLDVLEDDLRTEQRVVRWFESLEL